MDAEPISVPMVSKRLVNRKAKTTEAKPTEKKLEKSSLKAMGATEGTERPREKSGRRLAKPASGLGT